MLLDVVARVQSQTYTVAIVSKNRHNQPLYSRYNRAAQVNTNRRDSYWVQHVRRPKSNQTSTQGAAAQPGSTLRLLDAARFGNVTTLVDIFDEHKTKLQKLDLRYCPFRGSVFPRLMAAIPKADIYSLNFACSDLAGDDHKHIADTVCRHDSKIKDLNVTGNLEVDDTAVQSIFKLSEKAN